MNCKTLLQADQYSLLEYSHVECLTEQVQYLWRYGESSEGVPIQDVCPCVVDDDVRSDLVQRSVRVELYLLKVLQVFSAPVQLHLPLYGSWRYREMETGMVHYGDPP